MVLHNVRSFEMCVDLKQSLIVPMWPCVVHKTLKSSFSLAPSLSLSHTHTHTHTLTHMYTHTLTHIYTPHLHVCMDTHAHMLTYLCTHALTQHSTSFLCWISLKVLETSVCTPVLDNQAFLPAYRPLVYVLCGCCNIFWWNILYFAHNPNEMVLPMIKMKCLFNSWTNFFKFTQWLNYPCLRGANGYSPIIAQSLPDFEHVLN